MSAQEAQEQPTQQEQQKKVLWTPISIPRQLKDLIKTIADSEKKPLWSVVEEAVALYYAQKKKPRIKESLSWIDKIAWYTVKVCASAGALREVPSRENLARLEKNVSNIIQRTRVSTYAADLLLRVAKRYVSRLEGVDVNAILRGSGAEQNIVRSEVVRLRGDLNMALKMFVIDLLQAPEEAAAEDQDEL